MCSHISSSPLLPWTKPPADHFVGLFCDVDIGGSLRSLSGYGKGSKQKASTSTTSSSSSVFSSLREKIYSPRKSEVEPAEPTDPTTSGMTTEHATGKAGGDGSTSPLPLSPQSSPSENSTTLSDSHAMRSPAETPSPSSSPSPALKSDAFRPKSPANGHKSPRSLPVRKPSDPETPSPSPQFNSLRQGRARGAPGPRGRGGRGDARGALRRNISLDNLNQTGRSVGPDGLPANRARAPSQLSRGTSRGGGGAPSQMNTPSGPPGRGRGAPNAPPARGRVLHRRTNSGGPSIRSGPPVNRPPAPPQTRKTDATPSPSLATTPGTGLSSTSKPGRPLATSTGATPTPSPTQTQKQAPPPPLTLNRRPTGGTVPSDTTPSCSTLPSSPQRPSIPSERPKPTKKSSTPALHHAMKGTTSTGGYLSAKSSVPPPPRNQPSTARRTAGPTRSVGKKDLSRCRTSIYYGLGKRQSTLLQDLDKEFSDLENSVFAKVVSDSDDADHTLEQEEKILMRELSDSRLSGSTDEETRKMLASMDMELPEGSVMFNLDEPGDYETSRKQYVRSSVHPGEWEGWQRRVKRQTWEEWEQRIGSHGTRELAGEHKKKASPPTPSSPDESLSPASAERQSHLLPQARPQSELDGRAVTPYWLIHWWLTKNTTDRPTVSKHPLLELLLDNLNIITALAATITSTELNKLAHSFVCIFDGCGKMMVLVDHFVTQEIHDTIHSNTLLRTNTITTKIISSYAKIAGVAFLRKLLSPLLQQLVDESVAIEVDPKKIGPNGLCLDEQVQALEDTAQMILDHIIAAVDQLPYSFYQICNCLSTKISAKFSQENSYFGIGGFIFLRFICPSIVAPEAFSLLKKAPPAPVRRTLILVSKLIQNLANGVKQSKEDYMVECTARFVTRNQERINQVYERLSTIPPLPEDDPSVYSLIPVPLIEEALTIVHRLVIVHIDKIKEFLVDVDEVERVTYNLYENLNTVVLKSNIIMESLRQAQPMEPSSPLFKPYSLLIDVILADGCKAVTALLPQVPQTTDKEAIAEALMMVVHQHGDSVHFMKSLITKEMARATSLEQVLAGASQTNLLFSGLLKVLMREFLTRFWGPFFVKIDHENQCLEIDPPRASPDADIMKANEDLAELANYLIVLVCKNEKSIPQQAREICAYAQLKATQRFGEEQVDPLYGARLLCDRVFAPAGAFPTLFHLLPDLPQFHSRRTFVLMSKVVRNCLHQTICDEGYLIGLNHVVTAQRDNVLQLLRRLSQPVAGPVEVQQMAFAVQAEALVVLHHWLDTKMYDIKPALEHTTNSETIMYNIFDRLAAVIALYRFRLRRRIASGVCYFS